MTRGQARWSTRCGKFAYSRRKLAAAVAARQRKQTGENLETYRCAHCHAYHIGHVPLWKLQHQNRVA